MAGFWDKVQRNSTLVPVTKDQFLADLIANSDQHSLLGWQARDSHPSFLNYAIAKFAKHGITVTQDQLFLYYISDASMDLGVVASAVALSTQDLVQPRYARMTYQLDPVTGLITDFGVQTFSRWTFYNVPVKNVAPANLNLVNG